MMRIFKRKKTDEVEHKFNQIQNQVAVSFGNVKQDTSQIFQWLKYFYYKSAEQENIIQQLQQELQFVPRSHAEVREIIDKHYAFDDIMRRMKEIEAKIDRHAMEKQVVDLSGVHHKIDSSMSQVHGRIDKIALAHEPLLDRLDQLHTRISEIEQRPVHVQPQERSQVREAPAEVRAEPSRKENLRERLVRKITRNSKEYVKNVILSMVIKYRRITGMQLREIIVDEQGLASRSSFYRLLGELEQEGELDVVSDGKEKIYLAKISKTSVQK